jgi:hypothetical protein
VMERPKALVSIEDADAVQISHDFKKFGRIDAKESDEAYNALQWRNISWQQDKTL